MIVFHIAHQNAWNNAQQKGIYTGDTLESDGFIHCCLSKQLTGVLEKWFKGKSNLVVLEIKTDLLKSSVVFENLEGGEEKFPHIYGPVNLEAITNWKNIGEKNVDKEIPFEQFQVPAYEVWNKIWFLLTCGDFQSSHFNAMTVAWGSFGNMWNLPLAMVVVRPTRFTYEFINQYDNFTLCAFPKQYRTALNLIGSKSGRDTQKIIESGLTPIAAQKVSSPLFAEADLSIECRKLYWHDFLPEHFMDQRIEKHYKEGNYHRMFFGEMLAIRGDARRYSIK